MEWDVPEYEYIDNTVRLRKNKPAKTESGIDRFESEQYDEDGNELETEQLASAIAEEAVLLEMLPRAKDTPPDSRTKLKRELAAEALTRLEEAARTEADFREVTRQWDRLEQNAARRERSHIISRGEVPLEFEMSNDGVIFPLWKCNPVVRQMQQGNYLDYLSDCPYEMHDLTAQAYIRKIVLGLKEEHKEILYFLYLKYDKPQVLAEIRHQSDRNIRKVRDTVLRKIWKKVYKALAAMCKEGYSPTLREYRFMRRYENGMEDIDEETI